MNRTTRPGEPIVRQLDLPCVSTSATFSTSRPICLEFTASGTRLVIRIKNLAANAIFR